MNGFLLVALGGAVGASLRYGVGLTAARLLPQSWPWSTFLVNTLGSFAMGLAVGMLALKPVEGGPHLRLFLATGVLGGFTTFSAFSLELTEMIDDGAIVKSAGYAGASVLIGVLALMIGLWLARRALL